jgi:hypothetical protein
MRLRLKHRSATATACFGIRFAFIFAWVIHKPYTKESTMQSKAADLLERFSNRIDTLLYTFSQKIL